MMRDEPAVIAVSRSVLDATALAAWAAANYALLAPVQCRFLRAGMNDTYLLEDATNRSILRVYRQGWRTEGEVAGELAFLRRLAAAGVAVAEPLAGRDGRDVFTLAAPEDTRLVVRFAFAEGVLPVGSVQNSRLLGRALAELHAASNGITLSGARPRLDLDLLLGRPVSVLLQVLAGRADQVALLCALADRLSEAVEQRAPSLDAGPLHGDPHEGNARLDAHGRVTWFDFDLCGEGWRAYDLAVYRMAMRGRGSTEGWTAFLAGYQERRPLAQADTDAVPIFVAVRDIWHLAYHLGNAQRGGEWWWLDGAYLEQRLQTMRNWAREQLGWSL
jgi:Ser/Thr protein kinase RdoA (MazF antagonist)